MDSDLVVALRSRGVIVITAFDAGLTGKPDEEQLAFATAHECVLYTFNVCDFHRLHTQWISAGARACRYDSGAATAVLGRRAVAPHPASSRDHDHCKYPEPGRIPQQLAFTIGALAWCGRGDDLESDLRATDQWAGFQKDQDSRPRRRRQQGHLPAVFLTFQNHYLLE